MSLLPRSRRRSTATASLTILVASAALGMHFVTAQTPQDQQKALEKSFKQTVQPFFQKSCQTCHNSELGTAGVRTDQLDASLDERQIRTWEAIRGRLKSGSMPPKGMPQPSVEDRDKVVEWITQALEAARLRPASKNGMVRRLTLAQYRNTLRELLKIDDDVSAGLPPDAVSKDGFLNNKDAMQLSPLLTESYFAIAEDALNRAMVDPGKKPVIQNFRMDLGAGVNPAPLAETLVLGAGSALLDNADVLVTQLTPAKPFPFEPFRMKTKYRFLEGYRGNDTVRGWRDFDSIYHAVYADMRGTGGYPKGKAYSTVPEGLLLRPAIPSEEIFGASATEGPRANFKVSLRELPDNGRFRVTVMAAKYGDGLLLDAGAMKQFPSAEAVVVERPQEIQTVMIPQSGIYQVDVSEEKSAPGVDATRLNEGLTGVWPKEGGASPVGKTLTAGMVESRKSLPMDDAHNIGEGDFSVAAWIHPRKPGRQGIVSLGKADRSEGWFFEMTDVARGGGLRFQTAGRPVQANASVTSAAGSVAADTWQHVAVVARRGRNDIRIYVNGVLTGRAATGFAQFDDPAADLMIGRIPGAPPFDGEIADVRLYCRPLEEREVRALVEPGRKLIKEAPERRGDLTLKLGGREFIGALRPAFLVVRLGQGPLAFRARYAGLRDVERVTLTPLAATDAAAKQFLAFEKRAPRLGVYLGLRRDCGSTFAPVGPPQRVAAEQTAKYVFEGAIRNFPRPDVDKVNVNYLAGLSEIAVHSEYTDGRDMPRLLIRSVEFEGPYYDVWPPASHTKIFTGPDGRKIVRDFAVKAYRRPLTAAEDAALVGVFDASMASGRSFPESVKDALMVALTSPQFLFLTENSKSAAPEPLDGYELASKLSYWLWNGPPDKKTLQLAAAGTRPSLDSEVLRLTADPKFSRFVNEFAAQWLSLDKFQVVEVDRKLYPKLTRDARAQLKQEPAAFLEHLMRENLPVKDVIASDFVMVNEVTADYYGLPAVDSGFQFVPVKTDRKDLGGVLTLAATMSGLSDGRESNPVKRGAWMARKIIAEPPNDPPPNVPPLKEETKNLTLRERLELHRSAPACAQCHAKIDPWGVALEELDAGGRMKAKKVDASSKLPDGTTVGGIDDLKRHLSEERIDQVAFSVLKHLMIYAEGRSLTYNELNVLKQDALKLKPGGYRMRDMLLYVANSKVFLEK